MGGMMKSERGQVLILTVLIMAGLIAALGLAIDGGTVMLERRRMQNAADAAALAGTRVLARAICGSQDADDPAVESAVREYAVGNGGDGFLAEYVRAIGGGDVAPFSPGEPVGGGSIPVGATGVSVTVDIERPTYFIRLVGPDTAGASAHALAVTGPPRSLSVGMRPFGISKDALDSLTGGVTLGFGNCKGEGPDCYVKDSDGNVIAQHRGWMNLGYVFNESEADDFPRAVDPNADASVLAQWMADGKTLSLFVDDYIHAKPGSNASVVKEAKTLVGSEDVIYIPIFDHIFEFDEIETAKPQDGAPQGSDNFYHVIGFAAVTVTGANQGQKEITIQGTEHIADTGRLLPTEGQGFGESEGCKTGIQVVSLWR